MKGGCVLLPPLLVSNCLVNVHTDAITIVRTPYIVVRESENVMVTDGEDSEDGKDGV